LSSWLSHCSSWSQRHCGQSSVGSVGPDATDPPNGTASRVSCRSLVCDSSWLAFVFELAVVLKGPSDHQKDALGGVDSVFQLRMVGPAHTMRRSHDISMSTAAGSCPGGTPVARRNLAWNLCAHFMARVMALARTRGAFSGPTWPEEFSEHKTASSWQMQGTRPKQDWRTRG